MVNTVSVGSGLQHPLQPTLDEVIAVGIDCIADGRLVFAGGGLADIEKLVLIIIDVVMVPTRCPPLTTLITKLDFVVIGVDERNKLG